MTRIVRCIVAFFAFPLFVSANVVLHVSPQSLPGLIDAGASLRGDATSVESSDGGQIDFGTNGFIAIPAFSFPRGPFTLEALVQVHQYPATVNDGVIGSILACFSWDGIQSQGIDFRIGGGFLYPLLPSEAFTGQDDFVKPGVNRDERARLSNTLAALVVGGKNAGSAWKEVYTNQTVALNRWVLVTATCDGQVTRLFIDGIPATDMWRENGVTLVPNINPTVNLYVGASDGVAGRHLDGSLRFLKIYDRVLSEDEIRDNFAATTPSGCRYHIQVVRPIAGQFITPETVFEVRVIPLGNCPDRTRILADTFEVGISNNPHFDDSVVTFTTGRDTFSLETAGRYQDIGNDGVKYIRFACRNCRDTVLTKTSASVDPDANQVPIYFVSSPVSSTDHSVPRIKTRSDLRAVVNGRTLRIDNVATGSIVDICDSSGKLSGRFQGGNNIVSTTFTLRPGVYFVRTRTEAIRIVVR